jgi:hypothetical protein
MMDIRQWSTHREPYLEGCKFEGVEPNECVMSADREKTRPSQQGSLEGWTVAKVPQWSKRGLMEHIVELVVVDNQVREVKSLYVTKADGQLICDLYT